jgi:MtaA/CmuA family methyltransferase
MNGRQRIAAALRGEWPDTTPVMLHNFMCAAREAGVSMGRFRTDPEAIARAFLLAVERYGYDGILVDVDTVTLAAAAGVPVDRPDNEPARATGGALRSLEEARDIPPVNILNSPGIQVWLEAVRIIARRAGDEIYLRGNCDQSPFTLAALIRGMNDWLIECLDPEKEDLVHFLLERAAELTTQFLRAMAETGAHMLSNGNSVAGPDVVSPTIYRRFALPYDRRIAAEAHRLGLPHVLHICGNTGTILPDMIATGSDGLELDYKTDPRLACRLMGKSTTFIGNIDPGGVLALGTPRLVEEKTRELLSAFRDTPRFILNAGCAIPPTTPPENLHAMIRTAREWQR